MDNGEGSWAQYGSQAAPDTGYGQPARSMSFRNPHDESIAQNILVKHKDAKIEAKSRFAPSKVFSSKSSKQKYSQLEIFHALTAVIEGKEVAGPGVVEVLKDMFIAHEGNINFIPPKNVLKKTFGSKEKRERARLVETAAKSGNVEVVELLAPYADQISKDNALEIALASRGSRVHNHDTFGAESYPDPNRSFSRVPVGGQDTARKDRLIEILISKGANGSSTISAAVGFGDLRLLRMLLEGHPPGEKTSEALPIAVAFRDVETRHNLTGMLLEKGANVNYNDGEPILLATKAFDTVSLDMLLRRSPYPPSLNRAFAAALILGASEDRFTACEKLLRAGAVGAEVNKALNIAVTTEAHNENFLRLILPVASVDWESGHALALTITNNHPELLEMMLEKRPNEKTFDAAFEAALRRPNPRDQQKCCRMLLEAGPNPTSSSRGLLVAVKAQKEDICQLFMEKGASPNFEGGAAVQAATVAQNASILRLLVSNQYQHIEQSSLFAGFGAAMTRPPNKKKLELLRLILGAGFTGPPVDGGLITAAKQGPEGLQLCSLLVEHGASVDFTGGEALDFCARMGKFETLKILLHGTNRPSVHTISKIFQTALKDPKLRLEAATMILDAGKPEAGDIDAALDKFVADTPQDTKLFEVLLSHGASVHFKGHSPMVSAAKKYNEALLQFLFSHSTDTTAATAVFDAAARTGPTFWGNGACYSILSFLAEKGAEGKCLDKAFLKAAADGKAEARKFEADLLKYPLDINYEGGEALQLAVERSDWELITKMMQKGPSADSISMALPYIFTSNPGEAVAVAMLEIFLSAVGEVDVYFRHPTIREPMVFLSLNYYPKSSKILKMVLDAGFPVDGKMPSEHGELTGLYYAISSTDTIYGDDIIKLFIEYGADLHNHHEPLLLLAIKEKRHEIVRCLVEKGADVDLPDEAETTPLNWAVIKEDMISIRFLLDAKASPNDGSLHHAARTVNSEAINLLLKHGHDPNYPLPRLDGRPPLFELVFQSPLHLQTTHEPPAVKEKKMKLAIKALIDGGALTNARLPRAGNRSLLHHALDSPNPCLTTKALLDAGEYKNINAEFNIFSDQGFNFSPTKYVEKGASRGDKTQSPNLIQILKGFQAEDKLWKDHGPQPPDFCGAPKDLAVMETKRREVERARIEQEETINQRMKFQRRDLALEAEKEQAIMVLEERKFRMKQIQDQTLHEAAMKKEKDKLAIKEAETAMQMRRVRDENDNEVRLIQANKGLVAEQRLLMDSAVAARGFGIAGGRGMKALEWNPSRSNLSVSRRSMASRNDLNDLDES